MIRYSKYHAWLCLFLVFLMTFVQPLAVFADVMTSSNVFAVNPDYLIVSGSNARHYGLMSLELGDDDYAVSPMSSLGTVVNTVGTSGVTVNVGSTDVSTGTTYWTVVHPTLIDNRFHYSFECIDGRYISRVYFRLMDGSIPSPGVYDFSMDHSSDFSYDYSGFYLYSRRFLNNAEMIETLDNISALVESFSGEFYISPITVNLTSIDWFDVRSFINGRNVTIVNGDFTMRFVKSSSEPEYSTAGSDTSTQDYQSDVSGSLSDISSSIGDMSSSLDSAAENLEYISTSQNLIIQGIDNVIMHISDQLYAFWDQLYNLIHEPTYARLGDILDAIRNLDLEITVEMTEVTNAVNKMNQEVQNKLQHTTDKITGGYDSSVLESENQQIQSAVDEYDQSEQAILDSVEGNIEDFAYPSFDDLPLGTLGALGFFGGFMQGIFESMGSFNMIITFSLTLIFVLILIGYHRIRT